jgi:FkbM family methyltransferase
MGLLATLASRWLDRGQSLRGQSPTRPLSSREQLFVDQKAIAGDARAIFDVGAQHGQNALQYHRDFPRAHIVAFEPAPENLARTRAAVAGKDDRIEVIGAALGERAGELALNINSHDGTHSSLAIGDLRYWGEPARALGTITVPATTIDAFMAERGLDALDILSMDVQGGELPALRGAQEALRAGSIGLVVLEVTFKPIYRDIPLFWEVGAFLAGYGYNLYGLYDCNYAPANARVLTWADALFVAPRHQQLG